MKKTTYVKIAGFDFEYCGTTNAIAYYMGANENEIYDVYDRPSCYKVAIWRGWCEWCHNINRMNGDTNAFDCSLHIESHNCMMFTIRGHVKTTDGKFYELYITKEHNRCYEITNV